MWRKNVADYSKELDKELDRVYHRPVIILLKTKICIQECNIYIKLGLKKRSKFTSSCVTAINSVYNVELMTVFEPWGLVHSIVYYYNMFDTLYSDIPCSLHSYTHVTANTMKKIAHWYLY